MKIVNPQKATANDQQLCERAVIIAGKALFALRCDNDTREHDKLVKFVLDIVKDGQSAYCNQLTLGLIVYFTNYKNSDILLADDVLKQDRLETLILKS